LSVRLSGRPTREWRGIADWRFRAPVRIGDTIHVVTTVAACRNTKDPQAGFVTRAVAVRTQRDELVASGEFATLVRPGDAEP
jgi:acyl dehydratase